MHRILFLIAIVSFTSCQEIIDAPVPNLAWTEFDAPGLQPLSATERKAIEGVYTIGQSADDFGKEAAFKWSYVANKKDTVHYLSFFCAEDVRYFICQAKKKGDKILLNGYWRNVENTKTGKAHFTISTAEMRNEGSASEQRPSLGVTGVYGLFDDEPEKPIDFRYSRPLNTEKQYTIVAHRGGGRNNDLLPASENSVEIIALAAQLGANGIEIDVQLTKDGMPVIYHDERINDRLTEKTGIQGKVGSYTFAELQKEVNLKRGGKLPTLEQALQTVVYNTPLEFVWIDCKLPDGLKKIAALQKTFTAKAQSIGRKLEIVIGIPTEEVLGQFTQLPDYKNIPSLCELDTAIIKQVDADIWAPSYTKGQQTEEVTAVQSQGKRAIVWTVDVPNKIRDFMYEAKFNGICTNRPTMAAYYHYARQ